MKTESENIVGTKLYKIYRGKIDSIVHVVRVTAKTAFLNTGYKMKLPLWDTGNKLSDKDEYNMYSYDIETPELIAKKIKSDTISELRNYISSNKIEMYDIETLESIKKLLGI